jgi:transposase-like protein
MPRYSTERKAAVLSRLLPPNNLPVPEVAAAEGICSATLYNWLKQAKQKGVPVPGSRATNAEQWSNETKFAIVVETQSLNEAETAAYCREKGLYPEQIERWRQACIGGVGSRIEEGTSLREARNEIKRLKRVVDRKDKALAESAALLVLSKKFQALWEDEAS